MTQLLKSPEDAAEVLSIKRTTLYALIKSRELQVVKIGRRTLIPISELERYVERLTGVCTPKADAELAAGGR